MTIENSPRSYCIYTAKRAAVSVEKKCRSCSCVPNAACLVALLHSGLFDANVSEEIDIFALMMDSPFSSLLNVDVLISVLLGFAFKVNLRNMNKLGCFFVSVLL